MISIIKGVTPPGSNILDDLISPEQQQEEHNALIDLNSPELSAPFAGNHEVVDKQADRQYSSDNHLP